MATRQDVEESLALARKYMVALAQVIAEGEAVLRAADEADTGRVDRAMADLMALDNLPSGTVH